LEVEASFESVLKFEAEFNRADGLGLETREIKNGVGFLNLLAFADLVNHSVLTTDREF